MSSIHGQPQCCQDVTFIEVIECATICEPFPNIPIVGFSFNNFILTDTSIYAASGVQYIRWILTRNNVLVYDFGFQDKNNVCVELPNGCLYGALDLGIGNADIINFIEILLSVPSLPPNQKYQISSVAKDSFGQLSDNNGNIYTFYT